MTTEGLRARKSRLQRERVVEGALTALATHGIDGLTHRRVAEAAGVPLSSTTYYFATLDDLLEAAMTQAVQDDVRVVRESFAAVDPADAPAVLATYIREAIEPDGARVLVSAELALAAMRRPQLRPVLQIWDEAWDEVLAPVFGPVTDVLSAAVAGLMLRAMLAPDEFTLERITDSIRAAAGDPARRVP